VAQEIFPETLEYHISIFISITIASYFRHTFDRDVSRGVLRMAATSGQAAPPAEVRLSLPGNTDSLTVRQVTSIMTIEAGREAACRRAESFVC
jgi:hypothetical protein